MLLPDPFGATRPVRPGPTASERSSNNGVSSGHENDRCEQTIDGDELVAADPGTDGEPEEAWDTADTSGVE
ncbi:hypothetical protein GCM10009675_08290 [Prauserella alba]|uniref:Uncharacterized protein n=1 Tax=Prauserella alba TaxID=176898 RepID=A0ABP4FQL0_9PSEU